MEAAAHAREAKLAAKEQRKLAQEGKKTAKAAADQAWKILLEVQEKKAKMWEAHCLVLRVQKVKVKDLPKKPKCPLKPKVIQQDDGNSESSLGGESDE
jgi:hypothetical protein